MWLSLGHDEHFGTSKFWLTGLILSRICLGEFPKNELLAKLLTKNHAENLDEKIRGCKQVLLTSGYKRAIKCLAFWTMVLIPFSKTSASSGKKNSAAAPNCGPKVTDVIASWIKTKTKKFRANLFWRLFNKKKKGFPEWIPANWQKSDWHHQSKLPWKTVRLFHYESREKCSSAEI